VTMEMSMAKADTTLTPTDLRQWLNQEVRDVMKAAELRIKDATDFVTLYATGEISPSEAMRRVEQYDNRWREPILGVTTEENMTNAEILKLRDNAVSHPEGQFRSRVKRTSKPQHR